MQVTNISQFYLSQKGRNGNIIAREESVGYPGKIETEESAILSRKVSLKLFNLICLEIQCHLVDKGLYAGFFTEIKSGRSSSSSISSSGIENTKDNCGKRCMENEQRKSAGKERKKEGGSELYPAQHSLSIRISTLLCTCLLYYSLLCANLISLRALTNPPWTLSINLSGQKKRRNTPKGR